MFWIHVQIMIDVHVHYFRSWWMFPLRIVRLLGSYWTSCLISCRFLLLGGSGSGRSEEAPTTWNPSSQPRTAAPPQGLWGLPRAHKIFNAACSGSALGSPWVRHALDTLTEWYHLCMKYLNCLLKDSRATLSLRSLFRRSEVNALIPPEGELRSQTSYLTSSKLSRINHRVAIPQFTSRMPRPRTSDEPLTASCRAVRSLSWRTTLREWW